MSAPGSRSASSSAADAEGRGGSSATKLVHELSLAQAQRESGLARRQAADEKLRREHQARQRRKSARREKLIARSRARSDAKAKAAISPSDAAALVADGSDFISGGGKGYNHLTTYTNRRPFESEHARKLRLIFEEDHQQNLLVEQARLAERSRLLGYDADHRHPDIVAAEVQAEDSHADRGGSRTGLARKWAGTERDHEDKDWRSKTVARLEQEQHAKAAAAAARTRAHSGGPVDRTLRGITGTGVEGRATEHLDDEAQHEQEQELLQYGFMVSSTHLMQAAQVRAATEGREAQSIREAKRAERLSALQWNGDPNGDKPNIVPGGV